MNKLTILHDMCVTTRVISKVCIWRNDTLAIISEVTESSLLVSKEEDEVNPERTSIYSLVNIDNEILAANEDLLPVIKHLSIMLNPPAPAPAPLDHRNASGIIIKMIDRRTMYGEFEESLLAAIDSVIKIPLEYLFNEYDKDKELFIPKGKINEANWNEMLIRALYQNCGVWAEWKR